MLAEGVEFGKYGVLDDADARRLSNPVVPMTSKMLDRLKEEFENLLYPELRLYGRADRDRLLRKASETPFDFLEWAGIVGGLVLIVGLTRYGVSGLGLVDRIAIAFANFVLAVLLLIVMVGPFLVRRKRRGLRSQLQ